MQQLCNVPDVEYVYEGHGPFENRRNVVYFLVTADTECDNQAELDEDEGKLDPEGHPKNAIVSIVNAESLIFSADEDS